MNVYYGIVENRRDPLSLGRCQVRVVGLHTHDKISLPTEDLPWATPIQPITSAAMNGIGTSPIGPVEGTAVVLMFADVAKQQPVMLGTIGGIPDEQGAVDKDDDRNILTEDGVPSQFEKLIDKSLRTIPGPTNGTTLTFFDETGSTNLTEEIPVNARVRGFGIPKDTFITKIISGTQISISSPVSNYGENILSFEPPATNLGAVFESNAKKAGGFNFFDLLIGIIGKYTGLNLGGGLPKTTQTNSSGAVTSGTQTAASAGTVSTATGASTAPVPTTAAPGAPSVGTSVNDNIPTIPPPKSGANATKATRSIEALIAACDKVGLTSKEQKAAILGIVGGETKWELVSENAFYREDRFKEIFKTVVYKRPESEWQSYVKWEGDKAGFFSYVYGPTRRGANFLGNATDAEAGLYYGRGFIQFTGKATYQRYQKLGETYGLNLNIVNNPDSLNDDVDTCALVTALYFVDRVSKKVSPNAHPGYFEAAKRAVGNNAANTAKEKLEFYEYFYGTPGATTGVGKEAGAPQVETAPSDISADPDPFTKPGASQRSKDSASSQIGFRDPNNKYPLKEYVKEPDTNRLTRGVIEGTVVQSKDSARVVGVPKAITGQTWDQPEAPFGAMYPFNKVMETESGHIQEWDDTPGQERIHTYHRSGTFTEVDANGTQVNFIVGDSFTLMERNGCIRVAGECNITVDGDTNIYARSDANIQVEQNAKIEVGSNLEIDVATNTTLTIGGNLKIAAFGAIDISGASLRLHTLGGVKASLGGDLEITAAKMNLQSSGAFEVFSSSMGLTAASAVECSPTVRGVSIPASLIPGKAVTHINDVLEKPEIEFLKLKNPLNKHVPFLASPERRFEENTTIETPDDWDTPEGRAISEVQIDKDPSNAEIKPLDTAPTTGGVSVGKSIDDTEILSTTSFSNDFRLSKNFTLGMLIYGGVSGKHKLINQNLKDSRSGPTRVYTTQEIVSNLSYLAENVLEPMLDILPGGISGYEKTWRINSGYRLKGVISNEAPTSQHCKGQGVDIGILGVDKFGKTFDTIQKAEKVIQYDQCILEYRHPNSVWIHVSCKKQGNRKQAFTMVNDKAFDRTQFVLINPIPTKS